MQPTLYCFCWSIKHLETILGTREKQSYMNRVSYHHWIVFGMRQYSHSQCKEVRVWMCQGLSRGTPFSQHADGTVFYCSHLVLFLSDSLSHWLPRWYTVHQGTCWVYWDQIEWIWLDRLSKESRNSMYRKFGNRNMYLLLTWN